LARWHRAAHGRWLDGLIRREQHCVAKAFVMPHEMKSLAGLPGRMATDSMSG